MFDFGLRINLIFVQVEAVDADEGENAEISYSILEEDMQLLLAIDDKGAPTLILSTSPNIS